MVEAEKKVEFWRWPETTWINPNIDWKTGKYITAGVDVGSVSSQTVIMVDSNLYAYSNTRTGSDSPESARKAMKLAMGDSGMTEDNLDYCIGTGYGRVNVPMANQTITEIACHARGANYMYGPEIRTVMDMGGQDCKAIHINEQGKVIKFMMNDKCAAGTGRGMEVFADLIGVPVWEIGPRSFEVEKEPPMISSSCVVFAKSEVVGLLQAGWPENDIMASYCTAMAHRIVELLNRVGMQEKFAITGGIAKNIGITKRLERELGVTTAELNWADPQMCEAGLPFDTQIAGATGAALFATAMLERGKAKSQRKA
jgi:bzd-type benzoyl-CoA reductase Q subunit